MGLVDLDRYDTDLGGAEGEFGKVWSPESVLERALQHTNSREAFFWGSAEAENVVSFQPEDFESLKLSARQIFSDTIMLSKGRLCLTNCDSLAAIAQFADEEKLPGPEDVVWVVDPGLYDLDVLQFSGYDGSAQCIQDVDPLFLDGEVHLAIRLGKSRSLSLAAEHYARFPNQPTFYSIKKKKRA